MPNSKNNQPSINKKKDLLPYGFKARAERISAEYRSKVGLKKTDFLPCNMLTTCLKVIVREIPEIEAIAKETIDDLLGGGYDTFFSAVTLYCPHNDRLMIVHNHIHSNARRESNIMHECAHIILGHKMEEFDNSNGFDLRNYNEVQEAEAQYLGHCLQLPAEALKKYYLFEKRSKEEIAVLFTASSQAVKYRLDIAGIEALKRNIERRH